MDSQPHIYQEVVTWESILDMPNIFDALSRIVYIFAMRTTDAEDMKMIKTQDLVELEWKMDESQEQPGEKTDDGIYLLEAVLPAMKVRNTVLKGLVEKAKVVASVLDEVTKGGAGNEALQLINHEQYISEQVINKLQGKYDEFMAQMQAECGV